MAELMKIRGFRVNDEPGPRDFQAWRDCLVDEEEKCIFSELMRYFWTDPIISEGGAESDLRKSPTHLDVTMPAADREMELTTALEPSSLTSLGPLTLSTSLEVPGPNIFGEDPGIFVTKSPNFGQEMGSGENSSFSGHRSLLQAFTKTRLLCCTMA